MTMRYLFAAVAIAAAMMVGGVADAATRVGRLTGCVTWQPPSCTMMGSYNLIGQPVPPWMRVTVKGRTGNVNINCPGTVFKVTSVQVHEWCGWWWPLR